LRKRIALLVAVFAALAVPVAGSGKSVDDVNGPACTDVLIDNGTTTTGSYDESQAHVIFRIALAAPSCKQATYTLHVLDAGGSTEIASGSQPGDGASTVLVFSGATAVSVPAGTGDTVCVYLTTSLGGHVFDRAPDTGCGALTSGGGAGGTGFH
jgi:hypothetical protein